MKRLSKDSYLKYASNSVSKKNSNSIKKWAKDLNTHFSKEGLHAAFSVTQLYPTLCSLVNCSLPGSFVHGIIQARILERAATSSSKGSSMPRVLNPHFLHLPHWQADSNHLATQEVQRKAYRVPKAHKKMFNITNNQRIANENYNEVSPHTGQNSHPQKIYE